MTGDEDGLKTESTNLTSRDQSRESRDGIPIPKNEQIILWLISVNRLHNTSIFNAYFNSRPAGVGGISAPPGFPKKTSDNELKLSVPYRTLILRVSLKFKQNRLVTF